MVLVRAITIAVAAIACGPQRPPAERTEQTTVVAGPREPNAAHCPASYAAAEAQLCTNPSAQLTSCAYPEGLCSCRPPPPPCQGIAPDPDAPPPQTRWACAPPIDPDPPPRADGCPARAPSGACNAAGKTCSYGACCVDLFKCIDGTWKQTDSVCPA
ncbi:MAG TPA: hypothetical protein VIU61_10370 [Kofleriaceae bacterium]